MFLLLLLALLLVVAWYYLWRPKNLPPGPTGLPLIGCSAQLNASNAHLVLMEWAKEYGPLHSFYLGNRLIVVLGNSDIIREALIKQADIFSGRTPSMPGLHEGIVNANGPLWKEQRRFALSTLRDFGFGRPLMEQKIKIEVEYFLEDICRRKGSAFDPQYLLNNAVSNVICALVFGKRYEYDDVQFTKITDVLNLVVSRAGTNVLSPGQCYPILTAIIYAILTDVAKQFTIVMDFLKTNISNHREHFNSTDEPDDYISAFLKAQAEKSGDHFTDTQILWSVLDLFVAGTETTATTLRWAILYLGRHAEIQDRVYDEICTICGKGQLPNLADRANLPYTEAVMMEVQRIATLVPLSVPHKAVRNTTLMGYSIPKDAVVIPLLWAAHNDPVQFPEPKRFDPNRFLTPDMKVVKPDGFMPFSVGKRACLGESLARMELFLFFTAMISRHRFHFDDLEIPDPEDCFIGNAYAPKPFNVHIEARE